VIGVGDAAAPITLNNFAVMVHHDHLGSQPGIARPVKCSLYILGYQQLVFLRGIEER
jgi:hypothetical protein